ncbi:MAG: replication-associated recombination protein A [Clostridiales bacterium]|nr:replication-associated recombination protein A [Clostridiales bacterium]
MDMFENDLNKFSPLADRMRPKFIEDFIGQSHIISSSSFLVNAIKGGNLGSCIFYGPPGCGKTTIATIISNTANGNFKKLNAVSSGVGDAKEIIAEAKTSLELYGTRTYLLLDECHRWSKAQSDCVLEAIEKGYIIFIGSTTENPYISMTRAIVSRCKVFEFKPLTVDDIIVAINRALTSRTVGLGNHNIIMSEDTKKFLAYNSCGDLRSCYNALEFAVSCTEPNSDGEIVITNDMISNCLQKGNIALDENTSFDMLSAFCKSLRGSDTDAALFYAQKLLLSGYDPRILARRMIAHASEDIGMADSNALLLANCALNSCEKLGMPECNLTLCHAIIYICEAEKSNAVYEAMSMAMQDAEMYKNARVPNHLKNHPTGYDDGHGTYKYPHTYGGYVKQQYLPDELKYKRYYTPKNNGKEKGMIRKKDKI